MAGIAGARISGAKLTGCFVLALDIERAKCRQLKVGVVDVFAQAR